MDINKFLGKTEKENTPKPSKPPKPSKRDEVIQSEVSHLLTKASSLTREEFEAIIKNYKAAGRSVTKLEKILVEVYPPKAPPQARLKIKNGNLSEEQKQAILKELKQQSLITRGKCCICGKEGKLYSETCESCFASWGFAVIKNRLN